MFERLLQKHSARARLPAYRVVRNQHGSRFSENANSILRKNLRCYTYVMESVDSTRLAAGLLVHDVYQTLLAFLLVFRFYSANTSIGIFEKKGFA